MKRYRFLALLLVFLMTFSLCASAKTISNIATGAAGAVNEKDLIFATSRQSGATQVTSSVSAAIHITVNTNVGTACVLCPSWGDNKGNIDISVYEWKNDYATTVKGTLLGKASYSDFKDNSFLTVPVKENKGDILILVENGSDGVGVWLPDEPGEYTQTTFLNGSELGGKCMTAGYAPAKEKNVNRTAKKARPAYENIDATTVDENEGFQIIELDEGEETKKVLSTTGDSEGRSAMFADVDFGSESPKSVVFHAYIRDCVRNFGEIQIALDDLESKPVAAANILNEEKAASPHWEDIVVNVEQEVTGKHDVYLLTRRASSVDIEYFRFSKTKLKTTDLTEEIENFKPVSASELIDTKSDTWVASDILGRKLPDFDTVGAKREDKDVVLFYFTISAHHGWLGADWEYANNQKVVDSYLGDVSEIKNNYKFKGWKSSGFWNESIYGHYSLLDNWVMRKEFELLAAAGIDGVATDCSNGSTVFARGAMDVMRTVHKMKQDGYNAPGITYICPWSANSGTMLDLENLWSNVYSQGLYSDAWYYFDGKPMVMGFSGGVLAQPTGNELVDEMHKDIMENLTLRGPQSSYKAGQLSNNQWPWLEVYPQHGFCPTEDGGFECVAVGTAQNSNDEVASYTAMNGEGVYGRSYSYKDKFAHLTDSSCLYGYNFMEQWERALELDPKVVFVTGWNEWVAGHYPSEADNVQGAYVDQWIDEYSRDIEPTKGQLRDTSYIQLCSYIRKFKGVSKTPEASAPKSINIGGDFSQWEDVGPEYIGYKGGTEPRDGVGCGGNYYTNYTGRNDIVLSKVARDDSNIYFYTETAEALTPSTDSNWMRLYINSDRMFESGWEGFDYIVNRVSPEDGKAVVEKYVGANDSWSWEKVGTADMKVSGNKLMLSISKADLGIEGAVDLEFKWHDGGVNDGDWMDFYVNGDTAPVGRFNYRYVEDLNNCTKTADENIDFENKPLFKTRKFVMLEVNNPVAYNCGHRVKIDPENDGVMPLVINEKTLVPIRFITEGLGAQITWNAKTSTAVISVGGRRISVAEGKDRMKIEGQLSFRQLQTPAQTIEGRMYVPLRDLTEGLGFDCVWIEPGIIIIGKNANTVMYSEEGLANVIADIVSK